MCMIAHALTVKHQKILLFFRCMFVKIVDIQRMSLKYTTCILKKITPTAQHFSNFMIKGILNLLTQILQICYCADHKLTRCCFVFIKNLLFIRAVKKKRLESPHQILRSVSDMMHVLKISFLYCTLLLSLF